MEQLLKITTIPMKYEVQVEHPKLLMKQSQPQSEINTTPGSFNMESKNIQVKLDTYEARRSLGCMSAADLCAEAAQQGQQAAQDATAQYVEMGNQMAQIQKGVSIPDVVYSKLFSQSPTTQMVFLPSVGPQISWDSNNLNVEYTPADLNINWKINPVDMEFVPGSYTINITQYPEVKIEYLGKPMYIPPSADPDYVEPED